MKIFYRIIISAMVLSLVSISCSEDEIELTNCDCGCEDQFETITDPRDGHEYQTIQLGEQTWMAENMAYLPEISDFDASSDSFATYKVYGYKGEKLVSAKKQASYINFGVLYNWKASVDACPAGWHLPTSDEWGVLENYLIKNGYSFDAPVSSNKIAKSLASICGWNLSNYQTEGYVGYQPETNNTSCFSILPAGTDSYGIVGHFVLQGFETGFWTASDSINQAKIKYVNSHSSELISRDESKKNGFSVRCIKD